ncbi:MAG: agmatinase [Clostridiales bacterium]|jgi:agmatinase|nr:agmatinase [Clostridiales bacterium]
MWNKSDKISTCDYTMAEAIVFGAPFDGTTSFKPGARFAPGAIRADFDGLETYSPYLNADLSRVNVFDKGDLEFPFGNAREVLNIIEKATTEILDDNKLPIMLGGEHLITLGAIRAIAKKHSGLNVIHFDAHTDLRDEYLGERLSHATVMRRVWEIIGDNKLHQFGIRSGEKDEFEFAALHTNFYPKLDDSFDITPIKSLKGIIKGEPVYVSIDLDILDPSVFCGTGTQEPGGILFNQLLNAIHALRGLNIVGVDITELAPNYDQSGASTAVACKVLRESILTVLPGGDFNNE